MGEKGSEKVNEIIRFLKGSEKGVIKGDRGKHRPQKLDSKSGLLSAFCLVPGPSSHTS